MKGVFRRLYCCYGNLLGRENDNVFTNYWVEIWYYDSSFKSERVVKVTLSNISAGNCFEPS